MSFRSVSAQRASCYTIPNPPQSPFLIFSHPSKTGPIETVLDDKMGPPAGSVVCAVELDEEVLFTRVV